MGKRILYCVLDWGLGHATRSIPIIRSLLDQGHEVVIASDSLALKFLTAEFSGLTFYQLPSYNVEYKYESLILNGIYNWNRIRSAIKAEHVLTTHLSKMEKADAVISDNRYGCYETGLPTVMVTHQLQFRTGNALQDHIGRMMISRLLKPFDHIWIPDDEARTLSGVLSRSEDSRVRSIGWQSTLARADDEDHRHGEIKDESEAGQEEFAIVAILSGPEPIRTSLEIEIRNQFESLDINSVLVRGVQGSEQVQKEGNITIYDVLDRDSINQLISSASIVLCRSGYSSLMDLQAVGKKAILIPTPGQPEQKYLANRMKSMPHYIVQEQGALDIKSAIHDLENHNSIKANPEAGNLLDIATNELFKIESQ